MTSITNLTKFGYDLSDNSLLYIRKSPKYDVIDIFTTLGDDSRQYPNSELRDIDYENLLKELQDGGIPCYHIAGYAINSNAVSKLYNDKNIAVCVFVNGQRLTIVCGSVEHAKEVVEFISSHAIAGGIAPDIQAELDKKANAEDVYTKTQTDALIENINSFNVKKVDTLPTTDIDPHTIYLIPKEGSINDTHDEYLYIDGVWALVGNTAIELTAEAVEYNNGDITNVQEALDKLLYVAPVITSLTGGGTYEIGSTVNQVVLNWAINKTIKTQSFNQGIGSLDAAIRTYTVTGPITSNTTYTLTVNDGTKSASKSTTVAFSYKRYWGVSANNSLTNADILNLSKEFSSNRKQSRTFDCTGGKYFYFVIPTSWCNGISFKVGGLAFSDMEATTINLTNESGYESSYNVYRVKNIQTGSAIAVEVL